MKGTETKELTNEISQTFYLDPRERAQLVNSKIADILNAYPYLAGCTNPEQNAALNITTLLTAHKNPVFDAKSGDGLDVRLQHLIASDGNPVVWRMVNLALQLVSLEDHRMDISLDAKEGKYNPLTAGEFDYDSTKAMIKAEMKELWAANPELRDTMKKIKNMAVGVGDGAWY